LNNSVHTFGTYNIIPNQCLDSPSSKFFPNHSFVGICFIMHAISPAHLIRDLIISKILFDKECCYSVVQEINPIASSVYIAVGAVGTSVHALTSSSRSVGHEIAGNPVPRPVL
jgi:hypothetical protein